MSEYPTMRRYPERDGPIEGEIQATLKGLAQGTTTDLGGGILDTGAAITGAASEIDPSVQAFSPTASALSAANPFLQSLVDKYGSEALGEALYGKEDTPLLQKIRDDARLIGNVAGLGEMATAKAAKFAVEGIGDFMRYLPNVRPQAVTPDGQMMPLPDESLPNTSAPKSTGLLGGDKPQRFYHGTGETFEDFDPNAKYTFVSSEPRVANFFSQGTFEGAPNIRPVYLKDANFFDPKNPAHLESLTKSDWYKSNRRKLRKHPFDRMFLKGEGRGSLRDDYKMIETTGLDDALQEMGYDGFATYEMGAQNLAVFNVDNIISGVAKKAEGGVITLADAARNTGRGPRGIAALAPVARNMNRPMVG